MSTPRSTDALLVGTSEAPVMGARSSGFRWLLAQKYVQTAIFEISTLIQFARSVPSCGKPNIEGQIEYFRMEASALRGSGSVQMRARKVHGARQNRQRTTSVRNADVRR
jgi:hypothetical protein